MDVCRILRYSSPSGATVDFQKDNSVIALSQNYTKKPANRDLTGFGETAKKVMSAYFDKPLRHRKKEGWAKLFDLVSEDFEIVGDAKCLGTGRGPRKFPSKFSIVSEHV